jgi:hypothetical protein
VQLIEILEERSLSDSKLPFLLVLRRELDIDSFTPDSGHFEHLRSSVEVGCVHDHPSEQFYIIISLP